MSPYLAVSTATIIEERLSVFERLYGAKWPAEVDKLEPAIRQHMMLMGTDNPLRVAAHFGKQMAGEGKDPNYLIAVCAAIALRDRQRPNSIPATPP